GNPRRLGASRRDDYVDAALHQIGRQRRQPIVLAFGRAIRDRDVLPLEVSGLLESLVKRRNQVGRAFDRCAPEEPYHLHRRLLRPCRERPGGRRATEQCDDLAAVYHSIARSARRSDRGGTVRPSVLAVLRLMTKEKRVGCSTGMSAGFAPFRTLSKSGVT